MAVKVKVTDTKGTINFIKEVYEKFNKDYPFEYKFLDENFNKMYQSEDKLGTLLWIFTAMAVFIGCLGLFGLAAFAAERRTKEIGIRKVLGATTLNIASLLSKNFLLLVFVATIVAFPIAWWAMTKWLENFPYKVSISWWVFVVTTFIALSIATLTISFQAIKAAITSPIKSLRIE